MIGRAPRRSPCLFFKTVRAPDKKVGGAFQKTSANQDEAASWLEQRPYYFQGKKKENEMT